MSGRSPIPGDKNAHEIIGRTNVHNRTIRAQVTDVNADNGYVILTYAEMPSGGRYATVAPLWASFPDAKIGGASWGRFMPQQSDIVKVSFDYDDRPHIVGFDIVGQKSNIGDGRTGWPILNSLYKTAKTSPNATVDVDRNGRTEKVSIARYGQFIPLNPGEYDFMSSGGAYIYGNNRGRLHLAGGSTSISLFKNDLRISCNSQLLSHTADDCEFKLGQVRRLDSTDHLDKKLSTDSNGTFKEFRIKLKNSIGPGTSLDLGSLQLGNVVADTGDIEQINSADTRFLVRTHSAIGSKVFEMGVDISGNINIVTPKAAIICDNINLGSINAQEHLVKGDTYRSAESSMHSSINSALTALTTALSTISTSLGVTSGGLTVTGTGLLAASVAHVIPIVGPAIGAPAIAAASGGIVTATSGIVAATGGVVAASTAISNLIAAITTFESKTSTFLSQVSKTT